VKPAPGTSRGPGIFVVLSLLTLAVGLTLILLIPMRVNHDCSVNIQIAKLLLEGNVPYVDFFEINPPLIMYLTAVPVAIGNALSLHPILAFQLFILALVVLSALGVRRLDNESQGAVLFGWAIFSYALLLKNGFGQREHLFALSFIPYLFVRWRRYEGTPPGFRLSVLVGIAAAIGACLKPHFLFILAVSEIYWIVVHRRISDVIRPETVALAIAGLAYPLSFLLFPKEALDLFFGRWIPFVAEGYAVYNCDLATLVKFRIFVLAAVAAVPFGPGRFFDPTRSRLAKALGVAILANLLVYLVQQKGWDYHLYPAYGFAAIIGALFLSKLYLAVEMKRMARVGFLVAGLLMVLVPVSIGTRYRSFEPYPEPGLINLIEKLTEPGDRVLGISTSVDISFPALVQTGRRPGSRYLWFFPIPMLYKNVQAVRGEPFPYRTLKNASKSEVRILREMTEDIRNYKPKLVLIQSRYAGKPGCPVCPAGFNLPDYLGAMGFMENGLAGYRRLISGDIQGYVRVE
jgi:hypothetical protein